MNMNNKHGLRTWIEVDRKAIRRNFNVFKSLIPKRTKLMAVVKSNAYGHGLLDFSREMEKLGADFLGVDSVIEGIALRKQGISLPILVLGYTLPEMLSRAVDENISITVSTLEIVRYIVLYAKKFPKPLRIHVKVDTGMHRQGFLTADLPKILGELKVKSLKSKVEIEGLYTHFASAKNPAFPQETKAQIEEFKKWISAFKNAGLTPLAHAAATAGTLLFPESHFDMARIGIGLYGLWPAKETKAYFGNRIKLTPPLVWKSLITEVKRLPKGSRIGYDFTETLSRDSTVAIVPVGYWHGYPRALSSIGRASVDNKSCKVIGRVSMDMLTVDITDIRGAKAGNEVVLLGTDGANPASAEGIANLTDSSWYEVITRLNPLIKRIYVS